MAYSLDFRLRAVELLTKQIQIERISVILSVGVATLYRWKKRYREGHLKVCYPKVRRPYKIDEDALKDYLSKNQDAYQHEIAKELGVTKSAVQWALKRLEITRKKRHHITGSVMKNAAKPTQKK